MVCARTGSVVDHEGLDFFVVGHGEKLADKKQNPKTKRDPCTTRWVRGQDSVKKLSGRSLFSGLFGARKRRAARRARGGGSRGVQGSERTFVVANEFVIIKLSHVGPPVDRVSFRRTARNSSPVVSEHRA